MDISKLEVVSGTQKLEIKDPITKKKTDIVLEIISVESSEFKKRSLEIFREGLVEGKEIQKENVSEKQPRIIASLIKGWENITIGKKAFPYSEENAIELVTRFPWIGEQVDKFAVDLTNFMKG